MLDVEAVLARCETGGNRDTIGFFQALCSACRRRERLSRGADTSAWRLIHGRADGFEGLTIDIYGDVFVVEAHLESAASPTLECALSELSRLGVTIVLKDRWRRDPQARAGRVFERAASAATRIVLEEGLSFEVGLLGHQHTGLFLDARSVRRVVRQRSSGKRVLNLFCYTGSIGVAAAASGSRSTTNVDLRATHAPRIRRNYELNQLPMDSRTFLRDDASRFLSRAHKTGTTYDLIVVDPPRASKMTEKRCFDVRTGYAGILRRACRALAPGGSLVASNGAGTLDEIEILDHGAQAAAESSRIVAATTVIAPDSDFPPGSDRPTGRFVWFDFAN